MASRLFGFTRRQSLALIAGILVFSVLSAADVIPGGAPVAGLTAAEIEEQLQVRGKGLIQIDLGLTVTSSNVPWFKP